jgi:hypothetical protein
LGATRSEVEKRTVSKNTLRKSWSSEKHHVDEENNGQDDLTFKKCWEKQE